MKNFKNSHMLVIVIGVLLLCSFAAMTNAENVAPTKNVFAERPLIHVLGPSPAITPSAESSAVDSSVLESCDVLKDTNGTWYWYYHATSKDKDRWPGAYRICVATSKNPLGPWEKYENNPVIDWGDEPGVYPGSVTKIDDSFLMFVQSPVSLQDQGPFCIATAPKSEGPWTKYELNPVMTPGDWGAWDDGGFSEACARYHEGVFHCVYGGTKAPKIESLGYAYSFDAINWHKYQANPVVPLSRVPDASGFAEVHCYVEGPYIYVFHTLRYYTGEGTARGLGSYPGWDTEDLAVQVLTIDPHFKVSFPVLMMDLLGPKQSSRIQACLPIGLEAASKLAIATECTYDSDAKAGLRLHVRGSDDGVHCDTVDMFTFDIDLQPGKTVRKTVNLSPNSKFAKIVVENLDRSEAVKSLNVTATVGN